MTDRLSERLAAGAGVVAALMTIMYVVMPPSTGTNPSASYVVSVIASNREGALFKNLVGTLSFFLFLFFLGSLFSALGRAEGGTGWMSLVAFGAGLVMTAVHSVESVVAYALAWHVAREGNLAVVTALSDIQNLVAYFYAVPLSVILAAASVVSFRTRVLPRWIAWMGFVASGLWLVGAAGVLDPQHGLATGIGLGVGLVLVFLVWIPATSIALMRQTGAADQASVVRTAEAAPAGMG